MATNDIYRCVATWTGSLGQVFQWVWHYHQITAGTPDDSLLAAAIAANLALAWADIDNEVVDTVLGDQLEILLWDGVLNEFNGVGTADISALDGLSIADEFPSNVAPYVTFHTSKPKSRGKKFLFGIDEGAVDDGAPIAGMVVIMATFAAKFDAPITEGVIAFRPGNFNVLTETFLEWDQTTIGIGAFTGSQYRRLPGRGA